MKLKEFKERNRRYNIFKGWWDERFEQPRTDMQNWIRMEMENNFVNGELVWGFRKKSKK